MIGGLPLTVVDTAGLRESEDPIEREGIRRARQAIERAELVLFLADDREAGDDGSLADADRALLAQLPPAPPLLRLLNKCDLTGRAAGAVTGDDGCIRLSAATGEGIETLTATLCALAGLAATQEGVFSARSRHLAALRTARAGIVAARARIDARDLPELAAEELRRAQEALGEIAGRFAADDLLGRVFSQFCIGK